MDILYIVMPAYNEEDNILKVVEEWYQIIEKVGENSKLVIADGGSNDRTHAILVELQKIYSRIEILTNTAKEHGPKVIALYDYAIKNHADYVFQTDSDGQTDAKEFFEFWELRKKYDGIFGERSARKDGYFRIIVEKVVCLLLKINFGVNIPDANAPFRLMNTKILEKYLYKMNFDYALPNIMLVTYFKYYGEKMLFKNISFQSRQGGIGSLNIIKIAKIGWRALGEFRKFKKNM